MMIASVIHELKNLYLVSVIIVPSGHFILGEGSLLVPATQERTAYGGG